MSHRFAQLVALGPGKQFAKSRSSWSDHVRDSHGASTLPALGTVSLFQGSHSGGCAGVFSCGFGWHLPNNH